VSVFRGDVQRRVAEVVDRVDVGSGLSEQPDGRDVVLVGGVVQRTETAR
jgi:hypothetical protein